jgi:hypothetical protein
MRWSVRHGVRDLPVVALVYSAALLASNLWLESSRPSVEAHVLYDVSTNLRHLTHDPWFVLAASAFFTRGGLVFAIGGALLCVGLLQYVAGWRMTVVVAVTAHIIGTLVSEGVIAIRIATRDLPTAARGLLDVGPSYIIVGCAAAAVAWPGAPRLVRVLCAAAVTPLFIFTAWRLPAGRVDAMGHVTAFVVGVAWAGWKRRAPALGEEVSP